MEKEIKPLSKSEKFVCEMIWGNIPVEVAWIRDATVFQNGMKRFETDSEWKRIFAEENKTENKRKALILEPPFEWTYNFPLPKIKNK